MIPLQPLTELVLFLTNDCNLKCSYCYEPKHSVENLTQETGQKAIDWFINQAQLSQKPPMVGFYGGEPLLAFQMLQTLISYGRDLARRRDCKIRFGITTNGTLLSEERLDFLSQEQVDVILSMDGEQDTHDRFRKFPNGNGSFSVVEQLFPAITRYRPNSVIRMTVNPQTAKDLARNAQYFINKGFRNLAPVANTEALWTSDQWKLFESGCRQIATIYLEYKLSDKKLNIGFIDDGLKLIARRKRPPAACGAGKTLISVSTDGGLYPCHRFVSNHDFSGSHRMGDVWSGIDEKVRGPFARYTSNHCLGCYSPCEKCEGRVICGGGCIAKGDEYNHNFLSPLPMEQYMNSIWACIVKDVFEVLKTQKPELIPPMPSQEKNVKST